MGGDHASTEQLRERDRAGSTIDCVEDRSEKWTSVWLRRTFLGVLTLALVAALFGVMGDRVERLRATSTDGRWELSLEYARLARAGLDVPWQVTVRREGGFDGPVVLGVTGDYFDIYETQGFNPQPSASTRDGSTLFLEFDPPPSGELMVITYDAYIQPAAQQGADGTVAIRSGDQVLVSLAFETTLLP